MIRRIKNLMAVSAVAAAVLSCEKAKEQPARSVIPAGSRIGITATSQLMTKAYYIEEDDEICWDSSDALAVIHAPAGTGHYVSDGKFEYDEDEWEFLGNTGADIYEEDEYEWYAAYPYYFDLDEPCGEFAFWNSDGSARAASMYPDFNEYEISGQKDNLIGPFVPQYGKVVCEGGYFEMGLNQASCLVDLNICNYTGVPMSITEVKVTVPGHPISGWFVMDWESDEVVVTPINGRSYDYVRALPAYDLGTLESAYLRMPVAPFVLPSADSLTVEINFMFTDSDDVVKSTSQSQTIIANKDYYFSPGKEKAIYVVFSENPDPRPYVDPNENKLDGETEIVDISDGWQ